MVSKRVASAMRLLILPYLVGQFLRILIFLTHLLNRW
jgi:hypothetical protein